jgi:hypothetical protein
MRGNTVELCIPFHEQRCQIGLQRVQRRDLPVDPRQALADDRADLAARRPSATRRAASAELELNWQLPTGELPTSSDSQSSATFPSAPPSIPIANP